MSYALCKDICPSSTYNNNPRPVVPSALSAEHSRVPPPRRRPIVALGSVWPKSLTMPTCRGHMDLVRKMLRGSQLGLLLRLLVISCLLYPLQFIYLELSRKFQSVVSIQVFFKRWPLWTPSWISFKAPDEFSRTFSILFCLHVYFRSYNENFSLLVISSIQLIFLNDGHFERHLEFLGKLQRESPELLVCYWVYIFRAILKISDCCELFQAYD